MNRQGHPQQRTVMQSSNPSLSGGFVPRPPSTYPYGGGLAGTGQGQTVSRTVPGSLSNPLTGGPGSGYVPGMGGPTGTGGGRTPGGGMVSHPSYIPQRSSGQGAFGFGSGIGSASLSGNGLGQTTTGSSVSGNSEVGLDPNEFPALGASSANTTSASNNGGISGTSYASQAGTGVLGGGTGSSAPSGAGVTGTTQQRDFTESDFPALTTSQAQNSATANSSANPTTSPQSAQQQSADGTPASSHPHPPPGLNGFLSHSANQTEQQQQQHRQNLLGTLTSGLSSQSTATQQTPGMLNISAATARGMHANFGGLDSDKRNNMKLNQAAHAAWNAAGAQTTPANQQNGASYPSNGLESGLVNQSSHLPSTNHQQHIRQSRDIGNITSSSQNPNSLPNSTTHPSAHPQTPAQQVLMSAADRWGLLGLIAMIRSAGSLEGSGDQGLSSVGTDLGTMGLDMGYPGNLYSTFITPWADQSAAHTVEPDFHLPDCYSVHPPPPGPGKAAGFSDETLFFMFYSSPRDALQEVAAQELWNRNWRYHKELRMWITKESGTSPSNKIPGGESGTYTYWDPENWSKERKEITVMYTDLEEKSVPAFGNAMTLPVNVVGGTGSVTGSGTSGSVAGQVSSSQGNLQSPSLAAATQIPRGPTYQQVA